jgi:hypothetical protein
MAGLQRVFSIQKEQISNSTASNGVLAQMVFYMFHKEAYKP